MTGKIEQISQAVDILKKGGIILYPTDTVWGIGCDATNDKAVHKIYQLKKRCAEKSMLILLHTEQDFQRYASVSDQILPIIHQRTTPTTFILNGAKGIASNLIPPEKTIGIRLVKQGFCAQLIAAFGRPIVSTSANLAGEPTPLFFETICDTIKKGVDMVINPVYEETSTHMASSIVKIDENCKIEIIRP